MSEDFWNVKPPDMEGTKGRPPRTAATTSGTPAADDPNSPPPPPLADDVCKFSNPSPFLNSWYGSPLDPRKTSISSSSSSFSLSLSLDRVSYIIPGLFCNIKSLTALKCSQEKEAFKEARSEDKDDSPPAAGAAKQDPNQPSEAEEEEEEEEEQQKQKKKQQQQQQNKTEQMSETKMQR
jgi:hypothetical protein